MQLQIDRNNAADLGVRIGDISQALNTLVAGQEATTFNEGTDQYDVVVRSMNKYRTDVEGLGQMVVPSTKMGWVTLDRLVKPVEGSGPSSVERVNRQRQVTLLANTRPGGSAASITSEIDRFVAGMDLPSGYSSGYIGQSKEMGRAGMYFLLAFALSFIFMYIVLAAQFESFIHPVTILLTLPLAVPFGIVSLLVTGQTVNIFGSGSAAFIRRCQEERNFADRPHQHTAWAWPEPLRCHHWANKDRLRPILMTTIALVAGMMPLVLSSGAGSGTNRSIGILVVGGQSLCLLLTLLAVPVFYSLFDDLAEMKLFQYVSRFSDWLFGGIRRKMAGVAGSIIGRG